MKLEVGNIRMDSDAGITLGESSAQLQVVSQRVERSVEFTEPKRVRAMPLYAGMAIYVGLSTLGAMTMASAAFLANIAFVLPAIVLALPMPIAALLLPFIRRELEKAEQKKSHQQTLKRLQNEILEHLQSCGRALTVSTIQKELGWTEEQTLEIVHELVQSGEIDEDLDIEDGHYIYRAPEQFYIEADAVSASERHFETQRQLAITKGNT